jgi:hypothetical protein
VQSPEFKSQHHQKKKKRTKLFIEESVHLKITLSQASVSHGRNQEVEIRRITI